jgi:NADH dehydrogenase FAD-containing subunit
MSERLPVVVIIGGGFGGLAAAKALGRSAAQVVLIDRTTCFNVFSTRWRRPS